MEKVLVTGVCGIGKCTAEKLLAGGSAVIGADIEISESIRETAEKYPGKLFLYQTDLTDTDGLAEFVKRIVSVHGPVSGFVHCAGFDKMMPLHLSKARDIEALWKIHALVPMLITAALSKKNNHTENAAVVLITSQSAHEGAMGHSAYAAAKGAVEGFLAPAAAELMEKNIRINEVCLAPVKTPMSESWTNKLTDEGRKRLAESYPLGLGEPEDAAELICFLLSSESRWINGQIITADGGHSVRKV